MKKLLAAMFVALMMVGCGEDTKKPGGDSPESNQTSAATPRESNASLVETPPAKTAEVGGIDLDDNETRNRIIAEAIDSEKLDPRINERNLNDFDLTELLDLVDPFKTPDLDKQRIYFAPNQETPYTGWAKWVYDNGQINALGQIKDGKEDGLKTQWHENGQKWKEGTNKDGKQDGLETGWYPNGQKAGEGNFKDDKRNGLWTFWYENGQKWWEVNYKDGEKDGLWTKWYENGQMKDEITWKDGKLITAVVWRLNGEKSETNVVKGNGVLVSYNKDGTENGEAGPRRQQDHRPYAAGGVDQSEELESQHQSNHRRLAADGVDEVGDADPRQKDRR